jgi:hypothetical protein
MTATRKKPAGRKRPAVKRAPKAKLPKRTAALQPVFRINKIGDDSFSIEDRRTGKRVSTHKTFPAAWARRLKLFQAVYTSEDHD